jgi:hypothetical protein
MVRLTIPLVEVTAPDGTKSFWVAYSIPHKEAIAAVKGRIPADYTAELSVQRLQAASKFHGVRPGDVVKLNMDALSKQARDKFKLAKTSKTDKTSRSSRRRGHSSQAAKELDEMAMRMLAEIRRMPPGGRRLREIERLRNRLCSLLRPSRSKKDL